MLNSNWKWFFSMCTSEFFAFEATWSPSRCHCDLSSAASTFGQGWVKCADGELQKSESQAALGISESQSLLALCCILFHIFLGQPLNRRSSAIYNVAWDFRADLFTNLLSQKRTWNASNLTMSKPCSAKTSERSGQWFNDVSWCFDVPGRQWDTVDLGPWVVKKVGQVCCLGPLKIFEVPHGTSVGHQSHADSAMFVAKRCPGMPRDALLQPMAGVWDGSLISCAPPSRRQRRRELMVCKWKRQRWQRLL